MSAATAITIKASTIMSVRSPRRRASRVASQAPATMATTYAIPYQRISSESIEKAIGLGVKSIMVASVYPDPPVGRRAVDLAPRTWTQAVRPHGSYTDREQGVDGPAANQRPPHLSDPAVAGRPPNR